MLPESDPIELEDCVPRLELKLSCRRPGRRVLGQPRPERAVVVVDLLVGNPQAARDIRAGPS